MDPVSSSTLIDLIYKGIYGSASTLLKKRKERATDSLVAKLQSVDSDASDFTLSAWAKFQGRLSEVEVDCVTKFLNSPEADVFLRSLAISILTRDLDHYRTEMKDELAALLVLIGGLHPQRAEEIRDGLYQLLAEATDKVNTELRRRAQRKHGELIDRAMREKKAGYLRTIADRTTIFRRRRPAELLDILIFSERYKEQLHQHTSELIPAYFDVQQRAPIDSLYIPARLVSSKLEDAEIDFIELVEKQYRPVVLGDPGAGKSTLAQHIAHYYSDPTIQSQIVPFIVPLRAYEALKRTEHFSIQQFISTHITELLHIDVPPGAVDYILATRRGLVVFDGLDELLDIGRRREICAAVENFSSLFATAIILATSRSIGYSEAPLKPGVFETFELLPFSDRDVQHYAHTWFALDNRFTPSEKKAIAEAFIDESLTVPDLRQNALMLGLLCNVYRTIRQIPQNRAELYEKCATMLFERWDSERDIMRSGVLKSDARSALQDVALWIYTSNELADGVHEGDLLNRISEYWRRRYEDPNEALDAAKELLRAWRGRSWILTDVGSSAITRDRVYRFTHQTFLEYFASIELTRTNPSPEALWRVLESRLKSGSWEVIAQLAIQRINDFQVDAGDLVVRGLLESASATPVRSRLNLISFAVRNIDSLYVRTNTCRLLACACVELNLIGIPALSEMPIEWDDYYELSQFDVDDYSDVPPEMTPQDLEFLERAGLDLSDISAPLKSLTETAGEYGRIARDAVVEHLSEIMNSWNDVELGGKAFIMASALHKLLPSLNTDGSNDKEFSTTECILGLSGVARVRLAKMIPEWSKVNFWVPIVACRLGFLETASLLTLVGPEALMCSIGPFGESDAELFAEQILKVYIGAQPSVGDSDSARRSLRLVGDAWLVEDFTFDKDWFGATDFFRYIDRSINAGSRYQASDQMVTPEDDANVAFGAFILLATLMEIEQWPLSSYTRNTLNLGPVQSLQTVFIARNVPDMESHVERAIEASGFSGEQAEVIREWSRRQLHILPSNITNDAPRW